LTRTEQFEELRSLLFAIAYRILGSVSEAEDAVQETWLRFQTSPTEPASTKAFLSAVVTRIAIDVLRSARYRREQYVGNWLPEPVLGDLYEDSVRSAELADFASAVSARQALRGDRRRARARPVQRRSEACAGGHSSQQALSTQVRASWPVSDSGGRPVREPAQRKGLACRPNRHGAVRSGKGTTTVYWTAAGRDRTGCDSSCAGVPPPRRCPTWR